MVVIEIRTWSVRVQVGTQNAKLKKDEAHRVCILYSNDRNFSQNTLWIFCLLIKLLL